MKCFTYWLLALILVVPPLYAQEENKAPDPKPAETAPIEKQENSESSAQEDTTKEENGDKPAASKKRPEIKPPTSLIEQFTGDIERSIDSALVNPMLAGTEDFLTILQPDTHSTDRGIAILLPEWGQAATDTKAINYLRQHLPDEGWTTIAIQPLAKPLNYPSRQEKQAQAIEENGELLKAYQEQLTPLLAAVMEKAAEYPGIFLVIAQGNNAATLMDLYEQALVPPPNAFITLSAHRLTVTGNQRLAEQIAVTELPILDLVLKRDNQWIEHFALDRKKAAKRELKEIYRQRELMNFRTGYYPQEALAKEIKGWLTTIGW